MKKGTTIVELLIYMGLLSIFLVLLINILVVTLGFKLQSESTSALAGDMRFILSRLSYDLYNADSVSIPGSLGGNSQELELTRLGLTSSYEVDANEDLILTTSGTSMKLNGADTKVSGLSFERIGTVGEPPTFKINITLEGRIILTGARTETQTVETTFGLR